MKRFVLFVMLMMSVAVASAQVVFDAGNWDDGCQERWSFL